MAAVVVRQGKLEDRGRSLLLRVPHPSLLTGLQVTQAPSFHEPDFQGHYVAAGKCQLRDGAQSFPHRPVLQALQVLSVT